MIKAVLETSFCPCDKCVYESTCHIECKNFKNYTSEVSPVRRESLLDDFIKMQRLAISQLRVLKSGNLTTHAKV